MSRRAVLTCLALASAALAQQSGGLKPKPRAQEYGAHAEQAGISLGATMLSADEVKNTFATDHAGRYVVIEVALFPGATPLDISPQDFAVRIGADEVLIRPANPRAIASTIQRRKQGPPPKAGSPRQAARVMSPCTRLWASAMDQARPSTILQWARGAAVGAPGSVWAWASATARADLPFRHQARLTRTGRPWNWNSANRACPLASTPSRSRATCSSRCLPQVPKAAGKLHTS